MNSPNTLTLPRGAQNPFEALRDLLLGPLLAITTAMCTSFKVELLKAVHNFTTGGNTFNMALYDATATMDATTTAYTTANEVVGTGYSAGGKSLVNVTPTSSGTTALTDFDDIVWTGATFTARGAMIYNDTASGNPAVAVFDFGANIPVVAGNFTVTFPTANATAAVLRIA